MDKSEIVSSQDGSHTIISGRFGVSYHSKYGAIEESQTVFIDAGLHYFLSKRPSDISIFEMGFGTGLNAFLTLIESRNLNMPIQYTGIEAFPIELKMAEKLNYPDILSAAALKADFLKMHAAESKEEIRLSDSFTFKKLIGKLENFQSEQLFDIIYFDAFAPSAQAHLWAEDVLQNMYKILTPGGCLVTYCAKGVFKRTLKKVGFQVEGLPGPTGKREITRAIK